ncbi:MAG: hypothetical protein WAN65_13715 [Candidatus Sulfotelmatobacter sp.]
MPQKKKKPHFRVRAPETRRLSHEWQPAEEKIVIFTQKYLEHKCNAVAACVSMGMTRRSALANAWYYKRKARIQIADALRALGYSEGDNAARLIALAKQRNKSESLKAVKEVNRVFGAYPAEAPATPPLTINIVMDVEA